MERSYFKLFPPKKRWSTADRIIVAVIVISIILPLIPNVDERILSLAYRSNIACFGTGITRIFDRVCYQRPVSSFSNQQKVANISKDSPKYNRTTDMLVLAASGKEVQIPKYLMVGPVVIAVLGSIGYKYLELRRKRQEENAPNKTTVNLS